MVILQKFLQKRNLQAKKKLFINIIVLYVHTVQLNLNFTLACGYTRVPACLPHVKFINLTFTHTVAHNFGIHMPASEHTQHTSDALKELIHGFSYYM